MLTVFSQQDARWSKLKLGKSPCTMGRYGCTTTDITIALNWLYNTNITPLYVLPKLEYTPDGLILWQSLSKLGLKLVSRIKKRDELAINKALNNPGQVCLLEVNSGAHWVFLIGRKLPILGYRVIDPWDGRKKYTNTYRNISGCAIIGRA